VYSENSEKVKQAIQEKKPLSEIQPLIQKPFFIHQYPFLALCQNHPDSQAISTLLREKGALLVH
jgi:hypothetical protein